MLLGQLEYDDGLREALEAADVVLIGTGGSDLNVGVRALQSGECEGVACYEPVMDEYRTNLEAIIAEVDELVSDTTLIRGISPPAGFPDTDGPDRYTSTTGQRILCDALRDHGSDCADIVTAFNGETGAVNAFETGLMTNDPCCYPSGKGQQVIAQLLFDLGTGDLGS